MKKNKGEIRHSNFYKKIELPPLLSKEEEIELGKIVQESEGQVKDDAVEKLILANLRLVIRIAHNYSNCGIEMTI